MGLEEISKIVLCYSRRCEYNNVDGHCELKLIKISFMSTKEGSFSYCSDFKDEKGENINSYKKWSTYKYKHVRYLFYFKNICRNIPRYLRNKNQNIKMWIVEWLEA